MTLPGLPSLSNGLLSVLHVEALVDKRSLRGRRVFTDEPHLLLNSDMTRYRRVEFLPA